MRNLSFLFLFVTLTFSLYGQTYQYINIAAVNFRNSPEVKEGNIINVLKKGSRIEFVNLNGRWTKIKYDGLTGFVSSKYLSSTINDVSTNYNVVSSVAQTSKPWDSSNYTDSYMLDKIYTVGQLIKELQALDVNKEIIIYYGEVDPLPNLLRILKIIKVEERNKNPEIPMDKDHIAINAVTLKIF